MTEVLFLGPDPLPALGSDLPALCADDLGLAPGPPGWERFELSGTYSSAALLASAAVRERLRGSGATLLTWKGSAALEELAGEMGVRLANSPSERARRLENKRFFGPAATAAGFPVPPQRSGRAGPEMERELRSLGGPFIFQLAQGFSGSQTYPAPDEAALRGLLERFRGHPCRVSQVVPGTPVTVTGVVGPGRTLLGRACLQLTGLPELTPHPLGSCGNDFSRPVPAAEEVARLGRRVGDWLRSEGHLGTFGLDLVIGEDGSAWCIEVNPRLVASVPLFSLTARDRAEPGILRHHLAGFGLWPTPPAPPELGCDWSQVILYQLRERRPGVDLRSGATGTEDGPAAPMGLQGPPPGRVGIVVQGRSRPGRELARIIFQGPCTDSQGALLPWLVVRVERLRHELEEA